MRVTVEPVPFRPVSITLETQDELDKFIAIFETVAENRVNHQPQVVRAAQQLYKYLLEDTQ